MWMTKSEHIGYNKSRMNFVTTSKHKVYSSYTEIIPVQMPTWTLPIFKSSKACFKDLKN